MKASIEWSHQTVLVTGAGGFIGSHVTERLTALGARTRALVRYNSANSWGWLDASPANRDIEVVMGDIRDRDSVQRTMRGVDIVFHLAALIGIPYSYHTPCSYLHTNAEGTLNVLQTAREAGVRLVVHTSTSEVYGTPRYVPIDEEHPLQAQSPYAASKIAGDKFAESFWRSFGTPIAVIRPFNTYGPRQSARAIIPTIISQALTQPQLRLGNLRPRRDFSYVDDAVEAFVRIAECPDAVGQVINVGSGQDISIGDLASTVLELVERKIPISCDDQRVRPEKSEVDRLCADNQKARNTLGWWPQRPLREGLIQTIDWVDENAGRYRQGVYAI